MKQQEQTPSSITLEKEIKIDRFNILQIYKKDIIPVTRIYVYLEGIELSPQRYVLWGYNVYELEQEEFMRVLSSQPMNSRKTLDIDYMKSICRLCVIDCDNTVNKIIDSITARMLNTK